MNDDIYKSPEADLDIDDNEMDPDPLASRTDRFLASVVDGLTVTPVWIGLMYYTGGFKYLSGELVMPYSYSLFMTFITSLVFIAINAKLMLKKGQTLGKKVLNIKMVTTENSAIGMSHLLKRYGFYWSLPLIPHIGPFINLINILFIFARSRRCLHDHVGGTKVIKLIKHND